MLTGEVLVKDRLRKISRLKRYFEQRKNAELLELKKAVAEKIRKSDWCRKLESQKMEHINTFSSMLDGEIDPSALQLLEGGILFYNDRIERARRALDEAVQLERMKKEAALEAMIEHRMWENLYGRNEQKIRRYIGKRQELEADEMALIRKKSE